VWGGGSSHLDVVGGRLEHLVLGAIENVDGGELALSVPVLAGLRRRHVHDLARMSLDHEVRALAARRRLVLPGAGREVDSGVSACPTGARRGDGVIVYVHMPLDKCLR
jgi:hypothetical protein